MEAASIPNLIEELQAQFIAQGLAVRALLRTNPAAAEELRQSSDLSATKLTPHRMAVALEHLAWLQG